MAIFSLLVFALALVVGQSSNPYQVLGISRHANDAEIRSAFKKLSLEYHPDRGGPSAADRYASIVNSYELLKDPKRRRQYDMTGSTSEQQFPSREQEGFFDVGEVMRQFQEQIRQQQQQQRARFQQQHQERRFQQQRGGGRNFFNNYEINDEEFEVVNFIDGFGRMQTAVIRKQRGLLTKLRQVLGWLMQNPSHLLLLTLLFFAVLCNCMGGRRRRD